MTEAPFIVRTSERKDFKREPALPTGRPLDWRERTDEERQEALRNREWRSKLMFRYGITPEQWYEKFDEQDGKCAICDNELIPGKGTHTDHEPDGGVRKWNGGKFRGLLCNGYNMRLGWYESNKEAVDEYLG